MGGKSLFWSLHGLYISGFLKQATAYCKALLDVERLHVCVLRQRDDVWRKLQEVNTSDRCCSALQPRIQSKCLVFEVILEKVRIFGHNSSV